MRPCRTCQSYHNNETNLYVYKFDNRILKSANKITKISRALKYGLYTETSFFAFEKFFPIFRRPQYQVLTLVFRIKEV